MKKLNYVKTSQQQKLLSQQDTALLVNLDVWAEILFYKLNLSTREKKETDGTVLAVFSVYWGTTYEYYMELRKDFLSIACDNDKYRRMEFST